jgi:hypothetical protein
LQLAVSCVTRVLVPCLQYIPIYYIYDYLQYNGNVLLKYKEHIQLSEHWTEFFSSDTAMDIHNEMHMAVIILSYTDTQHNPPYTEL